MTLTYITAPDLLAPRHNLKDFDVIEWNPDKISLSLIDKVVCSQLSVDPEAVRGKCRKRELVQARQIIFYLAHKHSGLTLKKIGEPYSKRDHSTVIHNLEQFHNYFDTEPTYKVIVERIEQKIL